LKQRDVSSIITVCWHCSNALIALDFAIYVELLPCNSGRDKLILLISKSDPNIDLNSFSLFKLPVTRFSFGDCLLLGYGFGSFLAIVFLVLAGAVLDLLFFFGICIITLLD